MKRTIAALLWGLLPVGGLAAAQTPAAHRLKHDPFNWSVLTQAVEKNRTK